MLNLSCVYFFFVTPINWTFEITTSIIFKPRPRGNHRNKQLRHLLIMDDTLSQPRWHFWRDVRRATAPIYKHWIIELGSLWRSHLLYKMTLQNQRTNSNSSVNFEVCLVDENSRLADLECVLSNTLHRLVKFYRNNISFEERRQLTVAPLKGRLDFKTSTVIMEKEEGQISFLELPVRILTF